MVLIHFESAITCNLPVFDARYSVGSLFMKHPETTPSYTASIVRTPTTLPAVRPGSDENLAEASPEVGLSVVDDVIVPYTVMVNYSISRSRQVIYRKELTIRAWRPSCYTTL